MHTPVSRAGRILLERVQVLRFRVYGLGCSPRHVTGCRLVEESRVLNALDEVADNIRQTPPVSRPASRSTPACRQGLTLVHF